MPRRSRGLLEQLAQTLREAPETELRRLSLSDTRSLQRRGLREREQRAGMMLVLLQRDVLLQANVVTAEMMNLRVRQSEQLTKLGNALVRGPRPVPGTRGPERRPVPMVGQVDEVDDEGEGGEWAATEGD